MAMLVAEARCNPPCTHCAKVAEAVSHVAAVCEICGQIPARAAEKTSCFRNECPFSEGRGPSGIEVKGLWGYSLQQVVDPPDVTHVGSTSLLCPFELQPRVLNPFISNYGSLYPQ